MTVRTSATTLFVVLMCFGASPAGAQTVPYTFVRIADSGQTGVSGAACIGVNDAGLVVFTTSGGSLFLGDGTSLRLVRPTDAQGRVSMLSCPGLNDGGEVAFTYSFASPARTALLMDRNGTLTELARSDAPPYATENDDLTVHSLSNAGGSLIKAADGLIYLVPGGVPIYVAAAGDPPVRAINSGTMNESHQVAFHGYRDASSGIRIGGIYRGTSQPLVEGKSAAIEYVAPVWPALNSTGRVVFVGDRPGDLKLHVLTTADGISFSDESGSIEPDTSQRIAINDTGRVVFAGLDPAGASAGIFIGPDAVNDRVIGPGDSLDGSTVARITLWQESLNNHGQVAFFAELQDGRTGVYRADPPMGPTVSDLALTTAEDTTTSGTLAGTDPTGRPLTYSIVSNGTKGIAAITDSAAGLFTYTPLADRHGTDSFTYMVNNGVADSPAGTVTVTIAPVNDRPVALEAGTTSQTSVRFDSSTDELRRFTNLPPVTGFTMMGWFRLAADRNGYSTFLGLGHLTSSTAYLLMTDADGTTLALWNGGGIQRGPALSVGTWYHLAATVSGTGAGQFRAYVNGVAAITGNGNPAIPAQRFSIANDSHVDWVNGSAAAVKVYDAVLTEAEIAQEMRDAGPVRTANLNSWYPLRASDALADESGNGRSLSVGGVLATDPAGPPLQEVTLTTPEDTPVNGAFAALDADGDALAFSIVSNASKGTVAITDPATGAFTYTPHPNANGADRFSFIASDGQLSSNVATISVSITPLNDAPVALDGTASVPAGGSVNGTLQASDAENHAITYAIVTNGAKGTATITGPGTGNYSYTAASGSSGTDTFTFTASDGSLQSAAATITVTINPPLVPAPIASSGTLSTMEDAAATSSLSATDPSGRPLTYSIVTNGARGTATITDATTGAFTYTPNPDASGADSFTFKASNGATDSNVATVTVSIAAVNDRPVASSLPLLPASSVRFDNVSDELMRTTGLPPVAGFTMMGWFRLAAIPSGYSTFLGLSHATSNSAYLVLASGSRLSLWNGARLALGTTLSTGTWYHVAMTVSGTGTGQLRAYLNGVLSLTSDGNAAVPAQRLSIGNDSHLEWLNGNAADVRIYDAPLTEGEIVQEMRSGSPVRTSGLNSWYPLFRTATATTDFSGNGRALTVRGALADDPAGPPVNHSTVITLEDTSVSGSLGASDADGDTLTYVLTSNASRGLAIVDSATGAFTYIPNPDEAGADSFTFAVNDGALGSPGATVTVSVVPVNDPPVAVNGSITVVAGATATGTLAATDVDSPSVTYAIVAQGTKGTATITDASTGVFTYTPNAGASGADAFTFRANDGAVGSNVATITVTITNVIVPAPTASDSTVFTSEDSAVTGTLVGADPGGQPLTYSIVTNGTKGIAAITNPSTGAFTYTPNLNESGADAFTFTVSNGAASSAAATVAVTIAPVNDPPLALPPPPASASAVRFDNVHDELLRTTSLPPVTGFTMMGWFRLITIPNTYSTFLALGHPTSSSAYLILATGSKLSLWNGQALRLGSTLTAGTWYHLAMTVSGTGAGQFRAYLNGALNITFDGNVNIPSSRLSIGNDSHLEWLNGSMAAVKVYDAVLTPAEIALEMARSRPVRTADLNSYYPLGSAADAANDYSGYGRTLTVAGALTTDPSAPAEVANEGIVTNEDTPVSGSLQASDVDGDPLAYAVVTNGSQGVVTLDGATGAFTYTPNPDANGVDTFTFKVSDGTVDSNIEAVVIMITPMDEPGTP